MILYDPSIIHPEAKLILNNLETIKWQLLASIGHALAEQRFGSYEWFIVTRRQDF